MIPARRNWLPAFVLAAMVALATAASGCVVHARATPTYDPPAPRYVEVDRRPGHVWVQGRWLWQHGQWNWRDGYWVRERRGYYYSQGYWTTRGTRRVWVKGTWSRGRQPTGVRTRDHRYRGKRTTPRRGGTWGPKTRDQRGRTWGPGTKRRGKAGGTWGPGKRSKPAKRGYRPPNRVKTRDHRRATPYKKTQKNKKKNKKKKKSRVKTRDHRDD